VVERVGPVLEVEVTAAVVIGLAVVGPVVPAAVVAEMADVIELPDVVVGREVLMALSALLETKAKKRKRRRSAPCKKRMKAPKSKFTPGGNRMAIVTKMEPSVILQNPQIVGATPAVVPAAEQMALSSSIASLSLRDLAVMFVSPQGVWLILIAIFADWPGTVGMMGAKSMMLPRAGTSFPLAAQKGDPGARNWGAGDGAAALYGICVLL
jgi:hypothetical protein